MTYESNQITNVRHNLFFHGEKGSSLSNFGEQSFDRTSTKMNNVKEKIIYIDIVYYLTVLPPQEYRLVIM